MWLVHLATLRHFWGSRDGLSVRVVLIIVRFSICCDLNRWFWGVLSPLFYTPALAQKGHIVHLVIWVLMCNRLSRGFLQLTHAEGVWVVIIRLLSDCFARVVLLVILVILVLRECGPILLLEPRLSTTSHRLVFRSLPCDRYRGGWWMLASLPLFDYEVVGLPDIWCRLLWLHQITHHLRLDS